MHILHFPVFFLTRTGLASQSEWNTSLMNPAARSLAISFAYGPTPLVVEVMQALLSGLRAQDKAQCMLGDLPRYAQHVRRLPCEDITMVTQEVNELAFLFG